MARPFVTALIDTYNHERFVEHAIRSVLQQDFPASEVEILVVDDGSTDRTPEIVRKFAPRARLVRKANGGQASAFNTGIAEARGEVVAFLDGDDWWSPGKLAAVTEVLSREPAVGLVGHGVTQVYLDGRERAELIRETTRFRVTSVKNARKFRMSRGFLGTSRMTYRKHLLHQIGEVPESLTFEADEYLFTLGSLLSDVVILRNSFTFYRIHENNLFQLSNVDPQGLGKKQQVLSSLACALSKALQQRHVASDIVKTIVECVEVEADQLRLRLHGGLPWETLLTEAKIIRIFHGDASLAQRLFSYARLAPALLMPPTAYYRWRSRLSGLRWYNDFRKRFFPFPVPKHIEHRQKAASGTGG